MSSLVLFLISLFLHGIHGRFLDLHQTSYDRKAYHFGEVVEKIEHSESISSSAPLKSRTQAQLWSFKTKKSVENDEDNLIGSNSSQKDLPSGNEDVQLNEIDLRGKANKIEGLFMKIRRLMKESEAVDLNDNGGEDVVMMDYAQPHRKPPIHNEKP